MLSQVAYHNYISFLVWSHQALQQLDSLLNAILPWSQQPDCSHLDQQLSGTVTKVLSGTHFLCLLRIYLPILLSGALFPGIHVLLLFVFLPHIFYYLSSCLLKSLNVSCWSKNIFILSSYLNLCSVGNLILG